MKEVVHIIALSSEEYDWLVECTARNQVGPQGNYREMMDDYMTENLEKALKAEKIGFINEKGEVTITVRIF